MVGYPGAGLDKGVQAPWNLSYCILLLRGLSPGLMSRHIQGLHSECPQIHMLRPNSQHDSLKVSLKDTLGRSFAPSIMCQRQQTPYLLALDLKSHSFQSQEAEEEVVMVVVVMVIVFCYSLWHTGLFVF